MYYSAKYNTHVHTKIFFNLADNVDTQNVHAHVAKYLYTVHALCMYIGLV